MSVGREEAQQNKHLFRKDEGQQVTFYCLSLRSRAQGVKVYVFYLSRRRIHNTNRDTYITIFSTQ